jgi:hypothetical protein
MKVTIAKMTGKSKVTRIHHFDTIVSDILGQDGIRECKFTCYKQRSSGRFSHEMSFVIAPADVDWKCKLPRIANPYMRVELGNFLANDAISIVARARTRYDDPNDHLYGFFSRDGKVDIHRIDAQMNLECHTIDASTNEYIGEEDAVVYH